MFMTHHAPPNGLDPGDRMPGVASFNDEMDDLMSDWSWRGRQTDRGHIYTASELKAYECWTRVFGGTRTMPAIVPWTFATYTGPSELPKRIGG